jgi:hypothetical protein
MANISTKWFVVAAFLVFITPTYIAANFAPVSAVGGTLVCMSSHPTIQMKSEHVRIYLKPESYEVKADFIFCNTDAKRNQLISFPIRISGYRGCAEHQGSLLSFKAWVDGRKTEFSKDNRVLVGVARKFKQIWSFLHRHYAIDNTERLVSRIVFRGNSETKISVQYSCNYEHEFMLDVVRYLFGTGATWKGIIEKAVFEICTNDLGSPGNIEVRLKDQFESDSFSKTDRKYEIEGFKPSPTGELLIFLPYQPIEPDLYP